jgi:transposase
MIDAAGASLVYLPSYSRDFNPIERAFSKLKAHLRKAADAVRASHARAGPARLTPSTAA